MLVAPWRTRKAREPNGIPGARRATILPMCRMIAAPLGLSGRLLIDPFLRMAQGLNMLNERNTKLGEWTHVHGWGAVYEEAGQLRAVRSTEACWDDSLLRTLRDRRVFLLHARKASAGGKTLENTHPFECEIAGARWFFCHNGTVRDPLPDPLTPTEGSTDSEKLFGLLQPYIDQDDVLAGLHAVYGGIHAFTSLNSFLLGPDDLWTVCLHTENPDYYTLTLAETDDGPIVSSEPLGELAGDRTAIPNGTALRIDRWSGAIEMYTLD
jgi:predicted glutamine amidotransferase